MRYKSPKRMKRITLLLLFTMLGYFSEAQQSFTLEEAVTYGLENQNSQKVNDFEIASAEQEIKEFRSIGLPKVSGGIDYNR